MAKKRSQDKPLMMPLDQGPEIPNSIPMGATMARCALALLTDEEIAQAVAAGDTNYQERRRKAQAAEEKSSD